MATTAAPAPMPTGKLGERALASREIGTDTNGLSLALDSITELDSVALTLEVSDGVVPLIPIVLVDV